VHSLWLVPLVIGLTALTSCGDEAHTRVPTERAGAAIGAAQARKDSPSAHLLAADQLPTAGASWSSTETARDDLEALGPCHVAALFDIGALTVARRTWTTDASMPHAVQVVAKFADNKSAWRAHEVLDSWRTDCPGRVDGKVGPLREVAVATGVGQAYRVAQDERATDLGIVRKGAYLSVVVIVASPANLPEDSALAKAAVKKIAATF
jgi:hypothetical protein